MSFNQRKLWRAVQSPRSIESTDEMEAVLEKYPYFQLLRTLVAKAKHDQQTPDAYDWLGKAAVYAPDRRRLRQVFYDEFTAAVPATDILQTPKTEDVPEEDHTSGHAIIIETPTVAEEDTSPDAVSDSADKDSLTEELPTPQQAIIDRFMKANPSISRDVDAEDAKPTADLAASSTELQDDLVTENLAEIMLKQGKEAKAIDLYEKLMLKYPEKKAYFAQKIDQLKNN